MNGYDLLCQQIDLWNDVAKANGFSNSQWSIYDYDPEDPIPEQWRNLNVVYSEHWGDTNPIVPVFGNTMVDLYRAANEAIRLSGDRHHVFIEGFKVENREGLGAVLVLTTGS